MFDGAHAHRQDEEGVVGEVGREVQEVGPWLLNAGGSTCRWITTTSTMFLLGGDRAQPVLLSGGRRGGFGTAGPS
eukprot:1049373-Heterocapsa_arctica.AAC.1